MSDPASPPQYRCLPDRSFELGDFALRSVEPGDIEAIRQWRNAQMDVLRQAEPISLQAQADYFATTVWPTFADERPTQVLLAFLERGQLIGYGGLVHIAWEHRRAEVSFLLATLLADTESAYRLRFAAYLDLIKQVAFDGLGFRRLWTETYAFRTAHIDTLERAGFRVEGRLRHHVLIDGRPVDSLFHGLLSDD